jgi:hypothetical protein
LAMKRKLRLAIAFGLGIANCAYAQEPTSTSIPQAPGTVQVGVGLADSPYLFINFFKGAGLGFLHNNPPSILSVDQYPTSTPATQRITYIIDYPPICSSSAPCKLGWKGTGALVFLSSAQVVSDPQGCAVTKNPVNYFSGANCAVTFYWTTQPNVGQGAGISFGFPFDRDGGHKFTYDNMSGAYLIRASDEAEYSLCAAGELVHCFTKEWLGGYARLHPQSIRPLGWTLPNQSGGGENGAQWKYRTPNGAFSWIAWTYLPNIWAGSASGRDQYILGAYPDMPAGWTDAEVFQASFAAAGASFPAVPFEAPQSNNGEVQLPIKPSGTLTGASISSNTLRGTQSGTIMPGMDVNNGVDAAGTCVIATVVSSGTFTTTGCSNVNNTTAYVYTPIASGQSVLVIDVAAFQDTTWIATGLTFSGCKNSAAACVDLKDSAYSRSWRPGFLVTTTISVGGRPAKFVTNGQFGGPSVVGGSASDISNATLVYDGVQGVVIYSRGGMSAGIPPEVQVAAANALNVGWWFNIPPYWVEPHYHSLSQLTKYVCANLKNDWWVENGNEQWNFIFQGNWYSARGWALGLFTQVNLTYSGLQARQNFGVITNDWCRSKSNLHRILAAQAVANAEVTDGSKFKGAGLSGANNRAYCNWVGGTYSAGKCNGDPGYDSYPNRPIDYADAISVASYYAGAQASTRTAIYSQILGACNGTSCSGLVAAATCYAGASPYNFSAATSQATRNGTTLTFNAGALSGLRSVPFFVSDSTHPSSIAANTRIIGADTTSTTVTLDTAVAGTVARGDTIMFTGCGNGGTPQEALTFVDLDSKDGAFIGGPTCNTAANNSIDCLRSVFWSAWNTVAANEVTPDHPHGVGLAAYEGGLSSLAPATINGDANSGADAANINNLLIAYRHSPLFFARTQYWNNAWFSNSQAVGNSNLVVQGGNIIHVGSQNWSLIGTILQPDPFQSYFAIGRINGGLNFLLKRDLNPASNDNSPMWIDDPA